MKKKKCSKCKKIKKLDGFHKNSKSPDGYMAQCKKCRNRYTKEYTAEVKTKPKITPSEKKCPKCNIIKPASDFYKNISKIDGLTVVCKKCSKKDNKEYYKKNKESILKRTSIYYQNNKKQARRSIRLWIKNNPERQKANNARWRKANPEKLREIKRNYCKNNRDKINENKRKRRKTDLLFNLRRRLEVSLRQAFLRREIRKPEGVFRLLNYSTEEFIEHINIELEKGCAICREKISSDNFHIAHIIPCAEAKTEKELIKLFALSNLTVAHSKCNIGLGTNRIE